MAKEGNVKDVKDTARAQPAPCAVDSQEAGLSPSGEARVLLHTEKAPEGAPSRGGESSKKTGAAASAQGLSAMAEEDLVDYEEGDSENHESLSPVLTQACSERKRSHKKVCRESNDFRTESGDGREPKAAAQAKPEVWITLSDAEEEGEVAEVQSNALTEGSKNRNTKCRVTSKSKGRSNRPDETPSAGSTDVASVESTAKGRQGSSGDADQLISKGEQPSSWDDWSAVYKWYTRQRPDHRWLPHVRRHGRSAQSQQKARGAPHTGGQDRERPQGGHRALPTCPPQAGSRTNVRESDDFEPEFSGDDLGPSFGNSDHPDDRSAPRRSTSWIPSSQSTAAAAVAAPCASPFGVSLSSQSALGAAQQSLWERERCVIQQQVDGLHRDIETERKERAMLSKELETLSHRVKEIDAKHDHLVKNYKRRLGQLVRKGCIPCDLDDHPDHPAPKRSYPDPENSA